MSDNTQQADGNTDDPRGTADRTFEARYGAELVDRGIATFPTLILRWQAVLELSDEDCVTVMHILSFYREPGQWPSVSMQAIGMSRKLDWRRIDRSMERLEALGYLRRPSVDRLHGSYHCDLSGLLSQLRKLAEREVTEAALRKQIAVLKASPLQV